MRTQTLEFNRRLFLRHIGTGLVACAAAGVLSKSQNAHAQPAQNTSGNLLQRRIPKSGELVPAIGLGTFLTFDLMPGQPREHLGDVLATYAGGGARIIDTSPLYGTAEVTVGDMSLNLDSSPRLFFANKIWATGDYLADESHALRSLELSESRLWRRPIDLMQCHSLVNVDVVVPYLRAWQREGRIRYVGVTHHEVDYLPPLTKWVERAAVDFVQMSYSIFNRRAEERLLPAALQNGVAVIVNMPFEKARLFKVVEGHDIPAFAREIGIDTWAQFFLKWVLAHPAVTCVIPSTSSSEHAAQNIAALRGPLPDKDLRDRMVRHMESIPAFLRLAEMPWYPGKKYSGLIAQAQEALRKRI
jgi:diketogulonate reductase-like aldo/keto reductase